MKLVLLGTSGYHPNEQRHTASLFLPEIGVALDAGTSFFRIRDHLTTDQLNIYLTHAHLDHIVGLTFLLNIIPLSEMHRVTVHAEQHVLTAVKEHLFAEPLFPLWPNIPLSPLLANSVSLLSDGSRLTSFPLVHPGGSLGYRMDTPGGSCAYVTDTTASTEAEYLRHIQDVDLLIHEAYFSDEERGLAEKTGHSTLSEVAKVAAKVNAKRLVLVHVDPKIHAEKEFCLHKAKEIFPQIVLGTDKMCLDF